LLLGYIKTKNKINKNFAKKDILTEKEKTISAKTQNRQSKIQN